MGVGGDIEPVPKISSDRINRAREWPPTLCEDEPVFAVFAKLHDSSLSGVEDMEGPPPGSGCWNGSHALCAPTFHGRRTDLGRPLRCERAAKPPQEQPELRECTIRSRSEGSGDGKAGVRTWKNA